MKKWITLLALVVATGSFWAVMDEPTAEAGNARNRQRAGYRGRLASAMVGRQASAVASLPASLKPFAQWEAADAADVRGATDGSGSPLTNGQECKWLRDKGSGGNNLRMETATGPTWIANAFNGKGALRFNNTQALGTAVSINTCPNSSTTIFTVAQKNGASVGLSLLATFGVSSFTVPGGSWHAIRDNAGFYMADASSGVIDITSTIPYDTRLRIVTMRRANPTPGTSFRGDGTSDVSGVALNYVAGPGFAYIGGWSTNLVAADVAAVLVFDRVLSDADCLIVEQYLANKYGVYNVPGVTWPALYNPIQQASIYAGTLNANMLGTSADPLKYHFDAEDIDGLGTANASLTDGATQATWVNRGVTSGNATQASDALRPTLQKALANGQDGMMFGGNGDILSIASSAAGLSFVHTTADWDIFIVGRKDLSSRQVLLANTDLSSEKGFVIDFDSAGKAHIKITNAVPGITNEITWPDAQAVGELFALEAYGTASSTAMRLGDLTGSNVNGTLATGDATNATTIGCLASTSVGSFDGGMFLVLVFNKRVPIAQQQALHDYFRSRFGL